MAALDQPWNPSGLTSGALNARSRDGAALPVENGLTSGGARAQQQEKIRADKDAEAAEQEAFGEAFEGKKGLSGLTGAIRQIAHEVVERAFGGFRLEGDKEIQVNGRGRSWKLSFQEPAKVGRPVDLVPEATTPPHPFKVTTRVTTSGSARIVEFQSHLLVTIMPINTVSVSGLASEDVPESDDTGWKTLLDDDTVWLETGFTAGVPTSYAIKSFGAGDVWDDFEGGKSLVEWEGADTVESPLQQTKARAIIFRTISQVDGSVRHIQVAHTNFLLITIDVDGKLLKVLQPFCGSEV